jgi:hypothetical protein
VPIEPASLSRVPISRALLGFFHVFLSLPGLRLWHGFKVAFMYVRSGLTWPGLTMTLMPTQQ